MSNKLIFIYNASSSVFSQLTDYAHKILSPHTYQCNLCKLTYGSFGMYRQWQKFLKTLPYELVFLHKDEVPNELPEAENVDPPAIFVKFKKTWLVVSAAEINKMQNLQELEQLLLTRLQEPRHESIMEQPNHSGKR